jgi:hypothetical protein
MGFPEWLRQRMENSIDVDSGSFSIKDYLHDVGENKLDIVKPWSKIGYTPTLTTTESDVWSKGGVYTFCTTAGKWDVVSSNNVDDIGTSIKSGTSTGGSTTSLIDAAANFLAATVVAIGDCVLLDKSGTSPEWGYVTAVAATELTIAGGFSSGGTGSGRAYEVIDKSATLGAHVVKVDYLTSGYVEKTEIFILNGTTAVQSINADFYRVNGFRVIATGTNNKPTGNLTLQGTGGGTTYSYIGLGFTRARNIQYTVPINKTLYIVSFMAAYSFAANQVNWGRLYTRANREPSTGLLTGSLFYPYTEVIASNGSVFVEIDVPTRLLEKTDIKISGIASTSGIASVVLRGYIIG